MLLTFLKGTKLLEVKDICSEFTLGEKKKKKKKGKAKTKSLIYLFILCIDLSKETGESMCLILLFLYNISTN